MFEKLKKKWNVSGLQLVLILCTFAIGGSLCGFAGRKILGLFPSFEKNVLYYILYVLLITLLWPLCVLLVSIFFGQYRFFLNYLDRIAKRMRIKK